MEDKLFIPVILGTAREERTSENVAKYLFSEIEKREDMDTELFDVRDFELAPDIYSSKFPGYKDAVLRADGLVIVIPEYNHGYPGILKNALDTLFKEYRHRAVGMVGVSRANWGGVRAIEGLTPVLRALGLTISQRDLHFPNAGSAFNDDGFPKDDKYKELTAGFLDEVAWLSRALKWGRENIK